MPKLTKSLMTRVLRDNGIKVSRELQSDYVQLYDTITNEGLLPTLEEYCGGSIPQPEPTPEPQPEPVPEPAPEPVPEPEPEPTPEPEPEPTLEPEPEPVPEPEPEPEPTPSDEFKTMQDKIKDFEQQNVPRGTTNIEGGKSPLFSVTNEPSKPTRKRRSKKKENEASFLEGYILLTIMDMAMPTGIVIIHNMIDKKTKLNNGDLMLDEDQFKKLEFSHATLP